MSETTQLQIGDKILYKGNTSIIWIIESIGEGKINCSSMKSGTSELIFQEFTITSIQKYIPPTITTFKRNNPNRF